MLMARKKKPKRDLGIGGAIQALRRAQGVTQQDLAGLAKIPLSVLSRIEQGETEDPRASTLLAIAEALGVSVGELFSPKPPAGEPKE